MISKNDQALAVAQGWLNGRLPDIPKLTVLAEHVAKEIDCSLPTAKKYLRQHVTDGHLHELRPGYDWSVKVPGATERAYLHQKWNPDARRGEIHIARGHDEYAHGRYGPGNSTYIVTTEYAADLTGRWRDEEARKEREEKEATAAQEKAEREEIDRRAPELHRMLRKLELLGENRRDALRRTELMDTEAYLDHLRPSDDRTVGERDVHIRVNAWGESNTDVLQAVLKAGLTHYMQSQPEVTCVNCHRRILSHTHMRGTLWWHADTTNAQCAPDGVTKAVPPQGS
ncbi:hypothetical protein [Streptomyces sp. NBC_00470]|uniref:hypothetical protein n=1 Tax=Streptomyces sp. NBC_00470 TaxID=2975753 RepID=UPI0030E00C33